MKRIRLFFRLIIISAVAMLVLSLFCLIYNYTGYHIKNENGATDYKWQSFQFSSTMKEGFSWFKFDKNGFNNIEDSTLEEKSIDILLMGSSHMEAVQIGKKENVGYLLNEYLPEYKTYNIGVSGHNIYTCVQNMQAACQTYNPQKYLILETSEVKLDENKMQQVIDGNFPEIESQDSGLMYKIQKYIPAAKSLYKSVNEWEKISYIGERADVKLKENKFGTYNETLDKFLASASKSTPQDCKLIIFYHPTLSIDSKGMLEPDEDAGYSQMFKKACENNNIIFIDETKDFIALYENKKVLAHGFTNTAIGTGHLNKYGHQVIASHLSDVIKTDMKEKNNDIK